MFLPSFQQEIFPVTELVVGESVCVGLEAGLEWSPQAARPGECRREERHAHMVCTELAPQPRNLHPLQVY